MSEMRMNVAKHAAAYQVSRSAVKNVQVANKGIERRRLPNPAKTKYLGLRRTKSTTMTMKKTIS